MNDLLTPADLRALPADELERLGQTSLLDHLLAQAVVAHQKYAPLTLEGLDRLLRDPDCLRFPTRLVYEYGEMAQHQFAQPDVDWRDPDGAGRVLYLRPTLREHPERVLQAVAYMIPVLNYGEVVTDAHCLSYGATLLGQMEDEFYAALCALADLVGAAPRFPGDRAVDPSVPAGCPM